MSLSNKPVLWKKLMNVSRQIPILNIGLKGASVRKSD